jgi:hypothetical protein
VGPTFTASPRVTIRITRAPQPAPVALHKPGCVECERRRKPIGQADRHTHSGLKLGDCFSRTAFDLVFRYGSVLQRSAVRQALIAYISLPAVNHLSARSVRHNTFEKHLDNLLVHVLSTIAADGTVARYDRDIASLLVEPTASGPVTTRH